MKKNKTIMYLYTEKCPIYVKREPVDPPILPIYGKNYFGAWGFYSKNNGERFAIRNGFSLKDLYKPINRYLSMYDIDNM